MPLARMTPVARKIGEVIDQIDARCRSTEGKEHSGGSDPRRELAESMGGDNWHKDQEVLDPLIGPHCPQCRPRHGGAVVNLRFYGDQAAGRCGYSSWCVDDDSTCGF